MQRYRKIGLIKMKSVSILDILVCPSCGNRLTRAEKSLVCPSGHTFDIARSGYVNLLPPGKSKNSHTGDEKAMIAARTGFLSRGHYTRISSVLADLVASDRDGAITLCDMGSGEGYHTVNLAKRIGAAGREVLAVGFDASKFGAEAAAKLAVREGIAPRDGVGADFSPAIQACFVPANIFHLPTRDECFDVSVSMFAPIAWDEVRRTLRRGGTLAVASSGREHLIEMRRIIYDDVREGDFSPEAAAGFTKIGEESLEYGITLSSGEEISDLFKMTPFYFRTTESGRKRLGSLDSLEVTVSVKYSLFRKE